MNIILALILMLIAGCQIGYVVAYHWRGKNNPTSVDDFVVDVFMPALAVMLIMCAIFLTPVL